MAAVRMMASGRGPDSLASFREMTAAARQTPGCSHAEDFVGVESGSDILHIELWETPAAWDAANARRATALAAVATQVEFYKFARFAPTGPAWVAIDEGARAETVRWPAAPGAIRILLQVTADPADPIQPSIDVSVETRREEGCLEFAFFRSVEFPENLALIESWASPEIYDLHWKLRLAGNSPPPPPAPPRRYGEMTFEWYAQCPFTLVDGCWVPQHPAQRMDTVIW